MINSDTFLGETTENLCLFFFLERMFVLWILKDVEDGIGRKLLIIRIVFRRWFGQKPSSKSPRSRFDPMKYWVGE